MTDNERLAAVEVKVQNVQDGINRVEGKVDTMTNKLDDGFVRRDEYEKETKELRSEIGNIKAKKTMTQMVTLAILVISLMANSVMLYKLFTGM